MGKKSCTALFLLTTQRDSRSFACMLPHEIEKGVIRLHIATADSPEACFKVSERVA
jgi:hypothetical protein